MSKKEVETQKYTAHWTREHEEILIDWADKAMCFRWLHSKSNQNYSCMNAWFTIPVICMSTITGTANFAQDRFQDEARGFVAMIVGGVNIFAGILTTIQQFLKISELNEAHRVASIAWDKFYRNIKVELAKNPTERMAVSEMIKISKEEFNRLMETSPVIEDKVIKDFKLTFDKEKLDEDPKKWTKKQKMFQDLKKPEICDVLESTRYSTYKPNKIKFTQTIKEETKNESIPLEYNVIDYSTYIKDIENFINKFEIEYNRHPTEKEILENYEDDKDYNIFKQELIKMNNNNNDNIELIIKE